MPGQKLQRLWYLPVKILTTKFTRNIVRMIQAMAQAAVTSTATDPAQERMEEQQPSVLPSLFHHHLGWWSCYFYFWLPRFQTSLHPRLVLPIIILWMQIIKVSSSLSSKATSRKASWKSWAWGRFSSNPAESVFHPATLAHPNPLSVLTVGGAKFDGTYIIYGQFFVELSIA